MACISFIDCSSHCSMCCIQEWRTTSIKNTRFCSKGLICLLITIFDTKASIKSVSHGSWTRLRPANVKHNYFVISYCKEKCMVQHVRIHSFGKMSSNDAEFPKLPNPTVYTGLCFRQSLSPVARKMKASFCTMSLSFYSKY